ncbi:C-3',4' desaturase [Acaryochloris thomasi RCC1774]|uniref:C-3',4' desaturase n=1 Tax=Acaryochloris thomasi RCC1774 TaxID=1764569 RepID=A0A2W1JBJ3_9CYAN|nr:C-3',4' desaturase CrtD [Acaryochloris thomasi]PZD71409.1 C-3',4' desaturase [Acaryochloris thomasi RCC1774]
MPQAQQVPSPTGCKVVVIGAGIGGLTAASLLAHRGYQVKIFEQAQIPGGCASTFKRRGFTFDVGATQVAGLEPGGIHHRIFTELGIDLPAASPCDPACAVFLPGEDRPISVWRDPDQWKAERQRQFPGSERFWQLMADLFEVNWAFQSRDPVIPPRSPWDVWQAVQALRPATLKTVPHIFSTVGQTLRAFGLGHDHRLKTFLDLQLKLYSQVDAEETALLYAATALGVSQHPQGLSHLYGSMQVLSDCLVEALKKSAGELYLGHSVQSIQKKDDANLPFKVQGHDTKENEWIEAADHVVANVTVQNLVDLLGKAAPASYQKRVQGLPTASGAFVVYLGVAAEAIPDDCPPHLQFLYDADGPIAENNSLFVSVSRPGDGRATDGQATIIASTFTDPDQWEQTDDYEGLKEKYAEDAIANLSQYFTLNANTIIHQEAGTPRTFERFTARQKGIVGGIGQRVPNFGPFGFSTRTPIKGLWLVGDSTHPGEGTAGVSYSALTAVKQIQAMS